MKKNLSYLGKLGIVLFYVLLAYPIGLFFYPPMLHFYMVILWGMAVFLYTVHLWSLFILASYIIKNKQPILP